MKLGISHALLRFSAASHSVALLGELDAFDWSVNQLEAFQCTATRFPSYRWCHSQALSPLSSCEARWVRNSCSHAERQLLGLLYTLAGRTALANYRVIMRTVMPPRAFELHVPAVSRSARLPN